MLMTITDTRITESTPETAQTVARSSIHLRGYDKMCEYDKTIEATTMFDNDNIVEDALLEANLRNALVDSELSEQEIKQAVSEINTTVIECAKTSMFLFEQFKALASHSGPAVDNPHDPFEQSVFVWIR